jgi:hypothetical protein
MHGQIAMLRKAALQFLPHARGEALIRTWLARVDTATLSEQSLFAHSADAFLLAADLMLSQPSASGATAFDRLAKSLSDAPDPVKTALAALCGARFRLLRLEITTGTQEMLAHDVLSGAVLHINGIDHPKLASGMRVFARAAMLADNVCCLAGTITPLDDAAFALARDHAAAGAAGPQANARWAEAVYAHVVQNGTLNVPGLNRPDDDFGVPPPEPEFKDGPVMQLARAWEALADSPPDEALLRRTRTLAVPRFMLEALDAACMARQAGTAGLANALERILLVQMETVQRREQAGSRQATLARLADALETQITQGLPETARSLFASLRRRLANGGARRPDDPAMERLLTRIKGLRAKTVAKGCTEQEALAAAEKVAELLDRYGLSLGELDFASQFCEGTGIQTTRRRMAPFDDCVMGIAAFFDCRVWVEQAPGATLRYIFFGLRGDVAAAEYLYEMVERAFETETHAFRATDLYLSMQGERRSASNSFQIGLAQGISDKLLALRRSRDSHLRTASGRDLVPMKAAMVDDELAKLGLDLHTRTGGGSRRILTDAFEAGEAAGKRFEFTPAIANAA